MGYRVTFLAEAEQCIVDQIAWYEEDEINGGAELADRWPTKLEQSIFEFESRPERFGFAPENGRWEPQLELRQMPFMPWKKKTAWRILFVINKEESIVTIVQIRHDLRPLLGEEELMMAKE